MSSKSAIKLAKNIMSALDQYGEARKCSSPETCTKENACYNCICSDLVRDLGRSTINFLKKSGVKID
jgi:hypothetical protein